MKAWQAWTVFGLAVIALAMVIPAEENAQRLRQKEKEERRAAWRAHWQRVRPRAWHELPILESPSIVPELPKMQLDTS